MESFSNVAYGRWAYGGPIVLDYSLIVNVDKLDDFGLNVYPTFSNGEVTIETNESLYNADIYARNEQGQVVHEEKGIELKNKTIDLTGVLSGTYFVQIIAENSEKTVKIVVVK